MIYVRIAIVYSAMHNRDRTTLNTIIIPIQAGSEAPIVQQTDTNPKVSDVWRSSITHPKPRKRNSVKRTAVELLDAKVLQKL